MKKIFSFIPALACCAALFAFSGCSDGETFTAKTYSTGESAVSSVSIDVSDREISISASDDGQVHISYYESEKEYYDIALGEDGSLTMTLVEDKEWTDYIGVKPSGEYRTIDIAVPNDLISELSVRTTNEKISAAPISVSENISLDSNGGGISFEKISVGKGLSLTAKNGSITGSVLGGWDDFAIACTIKKGDSNLPESKDGGEKTLTANCNNGDIDIDFIAQ